MCILKLVRLRLKAKRSSLVEIKCIAISARSPETLNEASHESSLVQIKDLI